MPSTLGPACTGLLTPRDARNLRAFATGAVATAIAFAGTLVLHKASGGGRFAPSLSPAAATVLLAVLALRASVRVIREAEKLLRKIQLDGLALGFGAGILFMLLYRLLELFGAHVPQSFSAVAVRALAEARPTAIAQRCPARLRLSAATDPGLTRRPGRQPGDPLAPYRHRQ